MKNPDSVGILIKAILIAILACLALAVYAEEKAPGITVNKDGSVLFSKEAIEKYAKNQIEKEQLLMQLLIENDAIKQEFIKYKNSKCVGVWSSK